MAMDKKILVIITKGEIGGAQQAVCNLAEGLKKQGANVTVGFGQGDFLNEKMAKAGVPTVNLRYLRRNHNPFSNLLFIFEIKKLLRKEKFDLVHFNSSNALSGALGAKMLRPAPKVIFTFHGLSLLDPNYEAPAALKFFYRLFFKFFLRFVDEKIFVSENNLQFCLDKKIVRHGTVVRNGIKLDEECLLPAEEAKKRLGDVVGADLIDKTIIGSIGRLAYPKNYEFLIENFSKIAAKHPAAIAVIIGDGPERKKYEKLIEQFKLKGRFFLAGEIKEAARLLRAFDIFTLVSKYEGMSLTLLEAMAAGRPILASDVGGNKETLAGTGRLYQSGDDDAFRQNLEEIIASGEERTRLGDDAKGVAANFSVEKMIAGYRNVFGL